MENSEHLPSSKRVCLTDLNRGPVSSVVRCSTPELDLNDMSFESFIEDVEEEQQRIAAASVSPSLLDQPPPEALDFNIESYVSFIEEVEKDQQSNGEVPVSLSVSDQTSSGTDSFPLSLDPDSHVNGLVFPREVLENILNRLGISDLASALLVCKLWHSIITHESFVTFKKIYYGLKGKLNKQEVYHAGLSVFSHIKTPLRPILRKHPQYPCIAALYDQANRDKELTEVQELLLLVVCCKSVHQLLDLVHMLSHPLEGGFSSPALSYSELSEILYCIASLVKTDFAPRYHYYLYYVLSVMERRHEVHITTEESSAGHTLATASRLTNQQLKIVRHPFQEGQTIKVLALAGTGKTTTLYHIAKANPHLPILYCAYNKTVQQHACNSIFADCINVKSKTFHALAYAHTAIPYKNKLGSDLKAHFISWNIKLKYFGPKKMCLAKCVMDTISKYFASADDSLGFRHVVNSSLTYKFSESIILAQSKQYWKKMQSLENNKVKMTHDGYLKLYQLTKPNLYQYRVILVDEAQDLSPAIIDILTRQQTAKVFVGDPNQQIYSFRGATNALSQITATHTYHLSRSFRFGPEISYACELALSHFKPDKKQTLIGTLQQSSITGDSVTGQKTVICRMNSTLFDEVAKIILSGSEARIGFTGVTEMKDLNSKYSFDVLEDIAALKRGVDVRSLKTEIKWICTSYEDLVYKAKESGDVSLLGKISVCNKYFAQFQSLIKRIRERIVFDFTAADMIFSTAHKSKGLEFDSVIVTDDYTADFTREVHVTLFDTDDDGVRRLSEHIYEVEVEEDERNLIYVAMSRAKHNLVISPTILSVLEMQSETFCYPRTPYSDPVYNMCHDCDINRPLLLFQEPTFHLSTEQKVSRHPRCAACCGESLFLKLQSTI